MSRVRLFPARVVRQDWASRAVSALSDSVDESGLDLYQVRVDPAAYEESAVALYVYRQVVEGVAYVGVVCDVAVQAAAEGHVRGHEAVHQQRVDALVWHHTRSDGPPALVALLHDAGPEFERTLAEVQQVEPTVSFIGRHGVQHTVWRLSEGPATSSLAAELGVAELYIADGHHRVTAALEEWRMAGNPPDAGLLCLLFAMDGLLLSSFHRRVPGPVDPATLLRLVETQFAVREVSQAPVPATGSLGLYVDHRWYAVTYAGDRPAGIAGLDVEILQQHVLDRLPPSPRPLETIPATADVDELVARCDLDSGALFTLAPPPPEAITEVADAGEVMPPKTTYFEPKPAAGIFLRP